MSCAVITAAMQQAGIRRLAVIAGDAHWVREQAGLWQQALPGDWITLSSARDLTPHVAPAALRTLLGREFTHALFDARYGFHAEAFAALAGTLRARVKQRFASMAQRRFFWERFFTSDRLAQTLANGDGARAAQLVDELFSEALPAQGEVTLVGAGPGDAGLLTLKGLQQIQQADVIVYDRLVSEEILSLVRRDAERIFVGKRAGHHCVPQEQINQLLLEQAQRGRRVVRLKGGDPFIFGRGGEELEALAAHHIPFSVVPGVTAASGCSAYSGIPLTHRDHAQSVRLVTGHLQQKNKLEWEKLAAEQQTLVFYMGLSQAPHIQQQLMRHGMRGDMPAALIENGTSTRQRVVTGTLDRLSELAQQVESPSLIIIGSVVSLRDRLRWF